MFGAELERVWGAPRFIRFYTASVLSAAATQLIVTWLLGSFYPTVGASGGIFGLLLAFGMMFPNRTIVLLIPPIPMKAKTFVAVYGALELFLGVTGTQEGVAHFAHLGGMLGGYLMIRYWRGQPPFGRRRRSTSLRKPPQNQSGAPEEASFRGPPVWRLPWSSCGCGSVAAQASVCCSPSYRFPSSLPPMQ